MVGFSRRAAGKLLPKESDLVCPEDKGESLSNQVINNAFLSVL